MDYDTTLQLYEKIGQAKMWEDVPDHHRHNKEKAFLEKVKSKRTGEYWQAQDLKNRELVPSDWVPPHVDKNGKPVKYPLKQVNGISRRRLADGSEWLLSRQTWTGLDQAGNPISVSFDDKEYFDDILAIYKLRPENPRESFCTLFLNNISLA